MHQTETEKTRANLSYRRLTMHANIIAPTTAPGNQSRRYRTPLIPQTTPWNE